MTPVLIPWVLRFGLIILPAVMLVAALVFGTEHAVGVLIGGILALADGLGIVYLAGALLEPGSTRSKPVLFILLFLKLGLVGGLLWASLSLLGISGAGLVAGIGAGLGALVLGVSRGTASPEGQRAMEEAEARIRAESEDLEDKGPDSR